MLLADVVADAVIDLEIAEDAVKMLLQRFGNAHRKHWITHEFRLPEEIVETKVIDLMFVRDRSECNVRRHVCKERDGFIHFLLILPAEIVFPQCLEFIPDGLLVARGFHELLNIEPVALRGWHAARGGMRLFDHAFVAERAHFIADRSAGYRKIPRR